MARQGLQAVVRIAGTDMRVGYILRAVLERDYGHRDVCIVSMTPDGTRGVLRIVLDVLCPTVRCVPGQLGEQVLQIAQERDFDVTWMMTHAVRI